MSFGDLPASRCRRSVSRRWWVWESNPAAYGTRADSTACRQIRGVRRPPPWRRAVVHGVVVGPAGGDGKCDGRLRDAGGGERGCGHDPGYGDRPRRSARRAGVHGDGGGEGESAVHRRPHPARGDADQVRPLHGAAGAHRRPAGSGGARAIPLDGPGAEGRGDAGQARASAGVARGARRRVLGGGPAGPTLDRRDADGGDDPDPGRHT